jgi:hypothetical protein
MNWHGDHKNRFSFESYTRLVASTVTSRAGLNFYFTWEIFSKDNYVFEI